MNADEFKYELEQNTVIKDNVEQSKFDRANNKILIRRSDYKNLTRRSTKFSPLKFWCTLHK